MQIVANEQVRAVAYRMEMARHYVEKAAAAAKVCHAYSVGTALGVAGCAEHVVAKRDFSEYTRLACAWFRDAFDYAAGL